MKDAIVTAHDRPLEAVLGWAASRDEPEKLVALRRLAGRRFSEMSWPSASEEEWRRTDLSEYDFSRFTVDISPSPTEAPVRLGLNGQSSEAARVRFVGDRLAELSLSQRHAENGLQVAPFTGLAGAAIPEAVLDVMRESILELDNRILAWHYYLLSHGVYVRIPDGMELEKPVLIEFAGGEAGQYWSPHVTVVAGESSRAQVLVVKGDADGPEAGGGGFVNYGLDLSVGANARVDYALVQHDGAGTDLFNHSRARVHRDAALTVFEAHFGSTLDKSRFTVDIVGSGSDVEMNGAFFAGTNDHLDLRTVQRHAAAASSSRSFYKGAVRDSGRSVFQGLIDVEPEARGTDAYLSNKNLVLNDGARADSIPSLRIRTNDVKCSHGSTTGKLDEEQVYYLMTRGFARSEALRELLEGYFDEVIRRAPEAVHGRLQEAVERRVIQGAELASV